MKNNRGVLENFIFIMKNIYIWDKKINIYYILYIISSSIIPFCYIIFPKFLIDNLINKSDNIKIILILILFFILLSITLCLKEYLDAIYDPKITYIRFQFLSMYYKKCMTMKYALTEYSSILDNIEKSFNAAYSKEKGISGLIRKMIDIGTESIILLGFIAILFRLNNLLIVALLINALFVFIYQYKAKINEYDKEEKKNKYLRRIRYLNEVMYDYKYGKDIRIFTMGNWIEKKFLSLSIEYIKFYSNIRDYFILSKKVDSIFLIFREGLIYSYLIYKVICGDIGIGSFSMYISIVYQFTEVASNLMSNIAFLKSENLIINDFREFLELEDEYKENYNYEDAIDNQINYKYDIELKDVSFCYPKSNNYIFENFNLKIEKGQKLAIVGLNGAGKTTLIKLICGLYELNEGDILFQGKSIKTFEKKDYYRNFSVVFQDISMLAFSLAENIALVENEDIDMDLLIDSLDKADILQKVKTLKNGVNTSLDKQLDIEGIKLSGGENQKIAIARALYKHGEIIILDEPTAALDPIAEYDLYSKFNNLINEKTAIYISHRLSSTKFCDRIILIDNGKIVEEGTHESLMKLDGEYAKLFNVQARYYKDNSEVIL